MDDEYMYEVSAAAAYEQGFHDGYNQAMDEIDSFEGVKPTIKMYVCLCPACHTVINKVDKYCSQCGVKFNWEEDQNAE